MWFDTAPLTRHGQNWHQHAIIPDNTRRHQIRQSWRHDNSQICVLHLLFSSHWVECVRCLTCMYRSLSSTLPEIDPDTAYVVCISICPYFLIWYYGIHMPLLPYMVIQPIVLGMALLWAAIDSALSQGPLLWRHNDMTVIVSRHTRGRERDTRQRLDNANARRLQTVNR